MADIDLIPQSYRRSRWLRQRLRGFGIVYALTLVSLVAVDFVLSAKVDVEASAIEALKAEKAAVIELKERLRRLQRQRSALQRQLNALQNLRGGPPVREVFVSIDRALAGDVWFTDWKFMRAAEFADPASPTVNTGYIVVIPENALQAEEQAWRLSTHMEIKARATNHSALADFVERLTLEPVIDEVKVLNTRSVRERGRAAVEFELAVVVSNEQPRGS